MILSVHHFVPLTTELADAFTSVVSERDSKSLYCGALLQPCPTLHDWVDCSLPGRSVRDISHARMLEWVAISSSKSPHGYRLYSIHNL